jgi:hypothetical protein
MEIQMTDESRHGSAPVCCYASGVDDSIGAAAAPSVRPLSICDAGPLCSHVPNILLYTIYLLVLYAGVTS